MGTFQIYKSVITFLKVNVKHKSVITFLKVNVNIYQ
jgi:hypothetical protein